MLERAYETHPERFPRGVPTASAPPSEVWINPLQHVVVEPAQPLERGIITKSLTRTHIEQRA